MNMKQQLKRMARHALSSILYRYPPFALAPERLYLLLHYLIETKDVPGAVVEVGCNLGGTTVIAKRMLDRLGIAKPYVCIDTFDGFVAEQFGTDVALGTPLSDQQRFSGNSRDLVAKILRQHQCADVELIQGDIVTLDGEALPAECSLALIDVDLTEPTYVALQRLWPRIARGGAILVDDCPPESSWKARQAYERFCAESGLQQQIRFGMGIIAR